MAVLRGGRRIGNFDFRIGLPRDKSLVDVNGDPRLARKPGGNPESTINRFLAQVSQGEGVSRPSRYLVVFYPPKRIKPLTEAELLASEHGGGSAGTRNDLDS